MKGNGEFIMEIKERISKLANAHKDDKEVLDVIYDTINGFTDYVKAVNEMETTITILRFRLEPEDFRERVELLDRNRRIIHNSVIAGVKMLNRMSKMAGLPLFFEGDVTDRIAVGDFAGLVSKTIFEERNR